MAQKLESSVEHVAQCNKGNDMQLFVIVSTFIIKLEKAIMQVNVKIIFMIKIIFVKFLI